MENKINPLLCDIETGMCEMPDQNNEMKMKSEKIATDKNIKIVYFTDPICSSCWGIEPQLRKLKLEYGHAFEMEYRMGGLLPDWNYNSGGISKPSDVAHHWDEVSLHYDMPIDGDLWLEDPLDSSFPPSIAFEAAQMQDPEKAVLFMRKIREMVFLEKKNIAKWEHIKNAAMSVGIDIDRFKIDYEGKAVAIFQDDLKLAREMGVRGFPTIFFMLGDGTSEMIYGTKPYAYYEMAILKLDSKVVKQEYQRDWKTLFAKYNSLTAKEFSELSGMPRKESELHLNELVENGNLAKTTTKNGAMWTLV